jgi:hypothetical protein
MSKISDMNPMGGPPVSDLPKLIAIEHARTLEREARLRIRDYEFVLPERQFDWTPWIPEQRTDEGGGYYFPQPQWTYTTDTGWDTGTGGAPIYGTPPTTTYNTYGTATGYGDVPLERGGTTTVTHTFTGAYTGADLAHIIGGEGVTYLYRRPYPVQTDGG